MTESLETPETQHTVNPVPRRHDREYNRLYRALAWVGIVAGSLFIVATVFFSGYVLGQHNGGGGPHHGPRAMMLRPLHGPDGPMGPPPGGPMGGPMSPDGGERSARLTPPAPNAPIPTQPRP